MTVKFTDAAIRAFRPRAAEYTIGDSQCTGLILRVTTRGVKTFVFVFRSKVSGKVTWVTLGRYPDLPLAKARKLADSARQRAALDAVPQTSKMNRQLVADVAYLKAQLATVHRKLAALKTIRTQHPTRSTRSRSRDRSDESNHD